MRTLAAGDFSKGGGEIGDGRGMGAELTVQIVAGVFCRSDCERLLPASTRRGLRQAREAQSVAEVARRLLLQGRWFSIRSNGTGSLRLSACATPAAAGDRKGIDAAARGGGRGARP